MRLIECFERAYVINLPDRADRRREMRRELQRAGLPLGRGRVEFFAAIRPDDPAGFPSLGARGCFLSHLEVLRRAARDRLESVLVMEDDLAFSTDLLAAQRRITDELVVSSWDMVYLGHVLDSRGGPPARLVRHQGPVLTTHFYGVNGPLFGRLISFLEALEARPPGHPDGGPMHLDGAYSTFRHQNPDVITLVGLPSLGYQRSSRSDVAGSKWFDVVPGLRALAALARTGKNRLRGRG